MYYWSHGISSTILFRGFSWLPSWHITAFTEGSTFAVESWSLAYSCYSIVSVNILPEMTEGSIYDSVLSTWSTQCICTFISRMKWMFICSLCSLKYKNNGFLSNVKPSPWNFVLSSPFLFPESYAHSRHQYSPQNFPFGFNSSVILVC